MAAKSRIAGSSSNGSVATLEPPAKGGATAAPKKPRGAAKTEHREIIIPQADIGSAVFHVVGEYPLIMHKFSNKQRQQIEDKQQKRAKGGKEARDPHAEYLAAMYVIEGEPGEPGCVYGVPVMSVKNSMVDAARYVDGLTMQFLKGAFRVNPTDGDLIRIYHGPDDPNMRTDTVRLSGMNRALDLRYRPEFKQWGLKFEIRSLSNAVSIEQLANLVQYAGFGCGIGEWRMEKSGNCFGSFRSAIPSDFEKGGVFFGVSDKPTKKKRA